MSHRFILTCQTYMGTKIAASSPLILVLQELIMPEKETLRRAQQDKGEGKEEDGNEEVGEYHGHV